MLRCYETGDIEKINLQPEQEREKNDDWTLFADICSKVFVDGEKVLAIIRPIEEYGKITLYALIDKDCGYKSISMFREIKKWIKEQLSRSDINRIELTTQFWFSNANRLARMLGFQLEGTMHKCFNGMDFNIWGIWK